MRLKEASERKRMRDTGEKTMDVPHQDDTIAKIINRLKITKQKEDKALITEVPTNIWLIKQVEETKEEGCNTRRDISEKIPKGRGYAKGATITTRTWRGRIADCAEMAKSKISISPDDDKAGEDWGELSK